jgi:hypothetical protein
MVEYVQDILPWKLWVVGNKAIKRLPNPQVPNTAEGYHRSPFNLLLFPASQFSKQCVRDWK